jgi:hypothetical protein
MNEHVIYLFIILLQVLTTLWEALQYKMFLCQLNAQSLVALRITRTGLNAEQDDFEK